MDYHREIRAARILELDVLRGVAILLVLGTHVPAYAFWAKAGWLGVDLFFVLSGFLISNLLFLEYRQWESIRIGQFFLRRALKIYPTFYCLYIATLTYGFCVDARFGWQNGLGEMFFLQNYLGSIWGHTWSLAIEEHFYIFLPLALTLMLKVRRRGNPFLPIPYLFLVVAVGCLAGRLTTAQSYPGFSHRLITSRLTCVSTR